MKNTLHIFWLILFSQTQAVVPCSEWKVMTATTTLAQACLEKRSTIVWKKSFKTRKEAEDYQLTALKADGLIYEIAEEKK